MTCQELALEAPQPSHWCSKVVRCARPMGSSANSQYNHDFVCWFVNLMNCAAETQQTNARMHLSRHRLCIECSAIESIMMNNILLLLVMCKFEIVAVGDLHIRKEEEKCSTAVPAASSAPLSSANTTAST